MAGGNQKRKRSEDSGPDPDDVFSDPSKKKKTASKRSRRLASLSPTSDTPSTAGQGSTSSFELGQAAGDADFLFVQNSRDPAFEGGKYGDYANGGGRRGSLEDTAFPEDKSLTSIPSVGSDSSEESAQSMTGEMGPAAEDRREVRRVERRDQRRKGRREARRRSARRHRAREEQDTLEEQERWLRDEPNWREGIPLRGQRTASDGWRPVKILGSGSFGVVGLYELPDTEANRQQTIRRVVVKQGVDTGSGINAGAKQLENEAKILKDFMQLEPPIKHIVKMYTHKEDTGRGYGEFDARDHRVARMFMEYCEGGDMENLMKRMYKKYTASSPMPEELILLIFRCLAKGLLAMEIGAEDINQTKVSGWLSNLVHFDIKPPNIFLGSKDGEEHIGDFGLADEVPDPTEQTKKHWDKNKVRGTHAWRTPEQKDAYHITKFRCSHNTYQVGLLIHFIICRGRLPSDAKFTANITRDDMYVETQGTGLLEAPYSLRLRRLVLLCLASSPLERISPRELIVDIEAALKVCKKIPQDEWLDGHMEPGVEEDLEEFATEYSDSGEGAEDVDDGEDEGEDSGNESYDGEEVGSDQDVDDNQGANSSDDDEEDYIATRTTGIARWY